MKLIDADALMEAIEIRMKSKEDDFKVVSELMAMNRYIAQVPPVKKQDNEWIPVEERLPVDDTDVIVCKSDGIINIAFWSGDAWMSLDSNYTLNVFAWMPLPEPYNPQN